MSKKEKTSFSKIGERYHSNLTALRVFNNQIGAFAGEHDKQVFENLIKGITDILPFSIKDIIDKEETIESNETIEKAFKFSESQEAEIKTFAKKPENLSKILKIVHTFRHESPDQENILRTSVLISLLIYFEAHIADLFHAFYERYPDALPAEEKSLSLSELREIGSIEEAEAFLISREVESILRESLDKQLNYFLKRLKIDLKQIEGFYTQIIEIDQRRNLFVHNRGKVNRTYLERVDSELIEAFSVTKDKTLTLTNDYLLQAIDTIELVSMILHQLCWRKWEKSEIIEADNQVNSVIYDALTEERYEFVERAANCSVKLDVESDYAKRAICINHAIVLRDSGKPDDVKKILKIYDWSASSLIFKLALAGVRNEEEEFYSLLPRCVAAEEIQKWQCENWPLFKNFRDTERFNIAMNTLFGDQEEK